MMGVVVIALFYKAYIFIIRRHLFWRALQAYNEHDLVDQ